MIASPVHFIRFLDIKSDLLRHQFFANDAGGQDFFEKKAKTRINTEFKRVLVENAYVHLPIRSSRMMGSVRSETIPQSPSAKNVPPARFLNADLRVQHSPFVMSRLSKKDIFS